MGEEGAPAAGLAGGAIGIAAIILLKSRPNSADKDCVLNIEFNGMT